MTVVADGMQELVGEQSWAVGVLDVLGGEVLLGVEQRSGGVVPRLAGSVAALCDGAPRFAVDASFERGGESPCARALMAAVMAMGRAVCGCGVRQASSDDSAGAGTGDGHENAGRDGGGAERLHGHTDSAFGAGLTGEGTVGEEFRGAPSAPGNGRSAGSEAAPRLRRARWTSVLTAETVESRRTAISR